MRKWGMVFMRWIPHPSPFTKVLGLEHDTVIVDLVATTNHHVKGTCLMVVQDVSPHRIWSAEIIGIDRQTEPIAAVKHHMHGLATRWNPKPNGWTTIDPISNMLLLFTQLYLKI